MKRITFLIITAILMSQSVSAQNDAIIYTDFEPNLCLDITSYDNYSTDTLKIDVDYDNVTDFFIKITVESGGVWFDYWTLGMESRVIDWDDDTNDSIVASDEAVWGSLPNSIGAPYGVHDINFMLGFRKIVNDGYCYAWLLLHINDVAYDNKHLCIDRYAFCTIPNYPLKWGQSAIDDGIGEITDLSFLVIYPNPTSGVVKIVADDIETVGIYNILGEKISEYAVDGGVFECDLGGIPNGLYTYIVRCDGQVKTGKIVVAK